MIDVRCPRCGALVAVPASATSPFACPRCGAGMQAPAAATGEVIDVKAEVVGEDVPHPSEVELSELEVLPAAGTPPDPRVKVRTWTYQGGGGPSCCGLGCLFLLIAFILMMKGVFSLF